MARKTPEERLMEKIEINEITGCWIFTGSINNKGYGQINVNGKLMYSHRLAYELFVGTLDPNLTIDHLCRVTDCCNSDHLEQVSMRENIMRGDTITAAHAKKTECPQGHLYDLANTYIRPNGGRDCLACRDARNKAHYAKQKAERQTN